MLSTIWYLAIAKTSCNVVGEQPRQQEGQQVLELRQIILQWRASQHDAPPAPARQRPQPLRPRRVPAVMQGQGLGTS